MNSTVHVAIGLIYVAVTLFLSGRFTPTSTVLFTATASPSILVGFDGAEETPDRLVTFRWSAPTANVKVASPLTRFAVLSLYTTSAHADTQTSVAIQNNVIAKFRPIFGRFHHYHMLVAIPYQPRSTLILDMISIPSSQIGNRSLGIAIAEMRLTPIMPQKWQLPPLTWLCMIGLSVLSITALQRRWQLTFMWYTALLACAGLLPWLITVFTTFDMNGWLIGAVGIVCFIIVLVQITRDLFQRQRERIPRFVLPVTLIQALTTVILLIVTWGLIRVWPVYAQKGWWMQLIFVGIITVGIILSLYPHIVRHTGAQTILRWLVPLLGIALIILYHFIILRQLNGEMLSDLPYHLDDARSFSTGKRLVRYMVWLDGHAQSTTQFYTTWYAYNGNKHISNPLLHASAGLIAVIIHDRFFMTAFPITLLIYHGVSMVMLAVIVRRFAGARVHWTWVWAGVLSIFASTALYFPDINPFLYKGQGGNIIVHNATTLVTRPVTWAALWVAAMALAPRHATRRIYWMLLATLLAILAALGKPNAPLAFVPAMLAVMIGTYIVHRSPAPQLWWWVLPVGCVVGVLAYQSTIRSNGGSDFAIDIWAVARMSSPYPLISMLQLTALPLTTLGMARWLWRDRFVQVCVLAFVVAVVQYWVFSEPADMQANNFAWGMRIMIPACYAIAIGTLLRMLHRGRSRWTTSLLVALATSHVIAGVLYLWQITLLGTYL